MKPISSLLPLLLLATVLPLCAVAGEPVVITLHQTGVATEHIALLEDVADIDTPSAEQRAALEEIDLWEFKEGEPREATISRGLIQTRLLLAGFAESDLTWRGAAETVVHRGGTVQASASKTVQPKPRSTARVRLTDLELEQALRERIAEAVQLPIDDVRVHLTNACLARVLPKDLLGQQGKLDLTLPNRPQPGRVTVGIRVLTDLKLVATIQTQVELSLRRSILAARADLPRGTRLTEDDLVEQPQWLTRQEPHPRRSDAVGAILSRDLFEGQGLRMADLVHRPATAGGDPAIVVKSRDKVRIVAKKGTLVVVVRDAEAQGQGRVGEWITVRNTASGRMVNARVVGPGEVEVPLF